MHAESTANRQAMQSIDSFLKNVSSFSFMVSFPFLFPFVSVCFSSDNYTAADAKPQALFCLRKEEEQGKIKKEKKGGSSMNLNEIIAVNLKRLRAERGFSLGKLSELSGVSKVMSRLMRLC